jgi:hypothetical protein
MNVDIQTAYAALILTAILCAIHLPFSDGHHLDYQDQYVFE